MKKSPRAPSSDAHPALVMHVEYDEIMCTIYGIMFIYEYDRED